MTLLEKVDKIESRITHLEMMTAISIKESLNLEEAVIYSGFTKGTLYNLIHRGKISVSKPGGKLVFIRKKDIDAYKMQNRKPSATEIETLVDDYNFKKNMK